MMHGQANIKSWFYVRVPNSAQPSGKELTPTASHENKRRQIANGVDFRHRILHDFFPMAQQPPVGQGLLIVEASRSHSDTPHSAVLLWTTDQPSAGTPA